MKMRRKGQAIKFIRYWTRKWTKPNMRNMMSMLFYHMHPKHTAAEPQFESEGVLEQTACRKNTLRMELGSES